LHQASSGATLQTAVLQRLFASKKSGRNLSMNFFKTLWKATDVALAMSGLRLDAGRFLLAWIPLLGMSGWLAYEAGQSGWHIEFAIGSWVFYYLGISLILGTRIKRVMLKKFSENHATKLYDMICGLMFFNIGLGVATAALHAVETIPLSLPLRWGLFVLLTVVGLGIKFWATWIVGINTYYFRDLFFEKSHGEYTARGPYRQLANPMYGAGNLHAYGPALITGSLLGLSFALACHIGIYAFYFIVEKPFIRRMYQTD